MPRRHADPSRRRFVRLALGGVVAVPVASVLAGRSAAAADVPKLDPASEKATRLSYTHDADSSDNPAREEGARCANCTHFHGGSGTQWATCNIFPEHRVNADGWCSSWFSAG